MATVYSLLLEVVHLLYMLIVNIGSVDIIYSLLLVIASLSVVCIYSMAAVSCKYCWQKVRRRDYEEHIRRSCPDLPMECVFECGEFIARKMMRQHCQQQCNNAKRILSQQEDDKFVITCIAVQETSD